MTAKQESLKVSIILDKMADGIDQLTKEQIENLLRTASTRLRQASHATAAEIEDLVEAMNKGDD